MAAVRPRSKRLSLQRSAAKSILSMACGALTLVPAQPAQGSAGCDAVISVAARIGRKTRIDSNLRITSASGVADIRAKARFGVCTQVAAPSVTLARGVSLYGVRSNDLTAAASSEIRSITAPYSMTTTPCSIEAIKCGKKRVAIADGTTFALEPGSYGRITVGSGATLVLASGRYEACRVLVATGGRVITGGADLHITRTIVLAENAIVDEGSTTQNQTQPRSRVELGGRSVRLSPNSTFSAQLFAPAAKVHLAQDSSLVGGFCARALNTRARAQIRCDAESTAANFCFSDVTVAANAEVEHSLKLGVRGGVILLEAALISGGVAAGDYDRDGWTDLYVVAGDTGTNALLRNRGDGTFEDQTLDAELVVSGERSSGPLFADYDGDGWLDLFVGAVNTSPMHFFRNDGDGTFSESTLATGITLPRDAFGASVADYDGDEDLDFAIATWTFPVLGDLGVETLWRNDGDGSFTASSEADGLGANSAATANIFSPNFADIDGDGDPDLLLASDFGNSQVWENDATGFFSQISSPSITDENGMGAAIGDYDNDGDLDWFVTSVHDPSGVAESNWGVTGNRFYQNDGGTFTDVTDATGTREGFWGWAACMADFDLDGHLDIFHVNGFGLLLQVAEEFHRDPSRLFLSDGDGSFLESALDAGIDDPRQGRGLSCFDYDRDGDVDIFIANNLEPSRLYRNELGGGSWLVVKLAGRSPNTEAIGARITVTTGDLVQIRELRAGTNFASQDPALAHFGLAGAASIDTIHVRWPDGASTTIDDVEINREIVVPHP